MYYNSVTKELTNVAPWGNHYYTDELKKEMFADWQEVSDDFKPPVPEMSKEEKVAALDIKYQPQFTALAQSLGLATLDSNQKVIDGIKSDYAALKEEYQKELEAINNG